MSEQGSIFRKVSLDRLSSPEQLDQKLVVVSPTGWAALIALTLLIMAALAWGIFGSISNTVQGGGILMYEGGIYTISSHTSGQVSEVLAHAGDQLEKGQVIAEVSVNEDALDELKLHIERIEENLAGLKDLEIENLPDKIDSLSGDISSEFLSIAAQIRSAESLQATQKIEAERNEQESALLVKERKEQWQLQQEQREQLKEQRELQEQQLQQQISSYLLQIEQLERGIVQYKDTKSRQHDAQINALSYDLDQAKRERDQAKALYKEGEITKSELARYEDAVSRIQDEMENVNNAYYHDYDANLASMETSLENTRLQLTQVQEQALSQSPAPAQVRVSEPEALGTDYLWAAHAQTGEQILSLSEQFYQRKQILQHDLGKDMGDLQAQLTKMQEELERDSVITSDYSGILTSLNIRANNFVQIGSDIGTIVRDDGADGRPTSVLLYVPIDKGMLIDEGMNVSISPVTVNREEHGYMEGYVDSVSIYAVTQEHMMVTLQNMQLVQTFGGQSAVIEVGVTLYLDESTTSGYLWSTPEGAPFTISPGTICMGEIIISKQRPIDMVVPFVKRLFSGAGGS